VLSDGTVAHGVLLSRRSQVCPREASKIPRVDAVPDWNIYEVVKRKTRNGIHEAGEKRVQLLGRKW